MTAVAVFTAAKARKLANYLKAHVGELNTGEIEFAYIDESEFEHIGQEFPIGPTKETLIKPGGGYDNIYEAITSLIRTTLETRLHDEHMPARTTGGIPEFLQQLVPQEHPMEAVVNQFVDSFRSNATAGKTVAREIARRIVKLANDAFDHSIGLSRS
jgi:hypothetical protein